MVTYFRKVKLFPYIWSMVKWWLPIWRKVKQRPYTCRRRKSDGQLPGVNKVVVLPIKKDQVVASYLEENQVVATYL